MPPDVAWIEPGWCIGSRPFAAQRAAIRGLGVDVVVAVQEPEPDEADGWAAHGVTLVALPTRDWVAIPPTHFDAVVAEVLRQRAEGHSVLLHCLAGINRAPTFAAAVLCERDGLEPGEAVRRVRAARPSAAPTTEQMASLRQWVAQRRRAAPARAQTDPTAPTGGRPG